MSTIEPTAFPVSPSPALEPKSPPAYLVPTGRIALKTLQHMKSQRQPIAMLTAYDYHLARLLAKAGAHILLVGDSAAMTVLGEDSTTKVSMDLLVILTHAVRRGAPDVFLMADMPFASYPDVQTAVKNAARFVREAGADCVKIEVDFRHKELLTAMSAAGLPLCAHLGLLPQRAAQQGGYIAQGRTSPEAKRLIDEATSMAQAGVNMILLEAVPDEVTAEIVKKVSIPVIGCGAGPSADGHVVVTHDLLGYSDHLPRFVDKLADVPATILDGAQKYIDAVTTRTYPTPKHQYRMKTP